MKMAGPDILLFVVGALLLGGATYAIVAQGGPAALGGGGSPTGVFTVDYATTSQAVGAAKSIPDLGPQTKVDVPVNATDVSKITFSVACADTVPAGAPAGAFQVTVAVTPPSGSGIAAPKPVTAACGPIKVEVPVASVPPATTAQGNTADDAKASLPADANATRAQGTWSVTISGSRGSGTPLPGLPAGDPSGTLTANADVWQAKLTPVAK